MARTEDLEYYRRRVTTERERAAKAPNEIIAGLHMTLADLYEESVDRADRGNVVLLPTLLRCQNDNR